MKRLIAITMAVILIVSSLSLNCIGAQGVYSWYCNRRKDNLQPPLPGEFASIKDYNCLWLNQCRSDSDEKKVAYLTFDAGYENGNVEKVLDVLKEKNVPGAFFILENLIDSNPDLIIRMSNEGHTVCNHTAHHKDMTKIMNIEDFSMELDELALAYKNLTGKDMAKFYRPPEGKFTLQNLEFAKELGYTTVFWSFAYADWDNNKQPTVDFAKKKIMDNVHNGAVILLHPTSSTNAAILGDIIDEMRNDGYEFSTLEELYKEVSKN